MTSFNRPSILFINSTIFLPIHSSFNKYLKLFHSLNTSQFPHSINTLRRRRLHNSREIKLLKRNTLIFPWTNPKPTYLGGLIYVQGHFPTCSPYQIYCKHNSDSIHYVLCSFNISHSAGLFSREFKYPLFYLNLHYSNWSLSSTTAVGFSFPSKKSFDF